LFFLRETLVRMWRNDSFSRHWRTSHGCFWMVTGAVLRPSISLCLRE